MYIARDVMHTFAGNVESILKLQSSAMITKMTVHDDGIVVKPDSDVILHFDYAWIGLIFT